LQVSRGDDRRNYLLKYMAFQLKKSNNTTTHSKTATDKTEKLAEERWLTAKQVRDTYGDAKAEHWFANDVLPWRADRYTASDKEEHREYCVRDDIFSRVEGLEQSSVVSSSSAMKPEDMENVESLMPDRDQPDIEQPTAGEGHASPEPRVQVKTEPPESKDELLVKAFLSNPAAKLNQLQKASTEAKVMVSQASGMRFGESFCEEVRKISGRLDKTIRIVDKITMGQEPNKSAIPKLLMTIASQMAEFEDLKKAGLAQFGIKSGLEKGPKKKKAKTDVE